MTNTIKAKTSFAGFPKELVKYLRDLRAHSNKGWFEAHRAEYDRLYVEAAKAFVEAVGPRLAKLAPDIQAEPKIDGSIFRIHRDARFTADKLPYKDHLDFIFWEGERNTTVSALFARVSPEAFTVGAGFHRADAHHLSAFRRAVSNAESGKALAGIAKKLRRRGYELEGTHYKRPPREYSEQGPATEFLLHNTLFAAHEDRPEVAFAADVVSTCVRHWKALLPLHRWLIDEVR